jgi:hypothetical protein
MQLKKAHQRTFLELNLQSVGAYFPERSLFQNQGGHWLQSARNTEG